MPIFSSNTVPAPLPQVVGGATPPDPIAEQAGALNYNIDLIFQWQYSNVDFHESWGDLKGALGCYIDGIGNSFDQTSLLMQLLSQAGQNYTSSAFPGDTFTPGGSSPTLEVSYIFGDSTLESPSGIQLTGAQTAAWLNVADDANAAANGSGVLTTGGIPNFYNSTTNVLTCSHVWLQLTLTVGTTNHVYVLDPSCKIQDPSHLGYVLNPGLGISGLESAMSSEAYPYSVSQLVTDAEANVIAGPPTYLEAFNRSAVRTDLTNYARNLISYIQTNMPGASLDDIIGGKTLTPITSTAYQSTLPYQIGSPSTSWGTTIPSPTYVNMVQISFASVGGLLIEYPASQLYASRLTITSDDSSPTNCVVTLTDNLTGVSTYLGTGSQIQGIDGMTVTYKFLNISYYRSPFQDLIFVPESGALPYNIVFAGAGPISRNMVTLQQRIYAQYVSEYGPGTANEPVWGSMLNMISLTRLAEDTWIADMLGRLTNVQAIPINACGTLVWLNIPGEEQGDFIFDILGEWSNAVSLAGLTTGPNIGGYGQVYSWATNLTESVALQQTTGAQAISSNIPLDTAISTLGSDSPNYVYMSSSVTDFADNVWPAIESAYAAYGDDFESYVSRLYSEGGADDASLLIPGAPNPWSSPITGDKSTGYFINTPWSTIDSFLYQGNSFGDIQTAFHGGEALPVNQPTPGASPKKPQKTGGDPIDLSTGDFIYTFEDFSTGSQSFPFGLEFSRYYDSSKQNQNGTLGLGWRHNFSDSISIPGDAMQSLGVDITIAGAAAIVGLLALIQIAQTQDNDLGTLSVCAVTKAWLQDQCSGNVAIYSSGIVDLVFARLPYLDTDTTYEYAPPPRYALTLAKTPTGFTLTDPQQTIKNFNAAGQWTSWTLPPASAPQVTVTLNYTGALLTSVSNGMGRTLTFAYTTHGANPYLTAVSDGTGREVSYSYAGTDPHLQLTAFTDPLLNQITYSYVSGQPALMSEYFLPANPTSPFVQNTFDTLMRVETQYDPNHNLYSYYFAGSRTTEVDPQSKSSIWQFNQYGSIVTEVDKLGYITTRTFDGLQRLLTEQYPELNYTAWSYPVSTTGVIGIAGYNNVMSKVYYSKPPTPLTTMTESWQYDVNWNKVSQYIDLNGNVYTFSYDGPSGGNTGNLLQIQRPQVTVGVFPTIVLAYNGRAQLTTFIDETSVTTKYSYDSATEELLSIVQDYGTGSHLNLTTTLGYDIATPNVGNVISIQNANGNTTALSYDAKRRIVSKVDPTPFAYVTNITYDANDNKLTVQRQTNSVPAFQIFTWTYSTEGKVLTLLDPLSFQTTLTYDTLRRVQTYTDAEEREWQYAWDPLNRISQLTDPSLTICVAKTYTPNGRLLTFTQYPGGSNTATTTYSYDIFDRPFRTTYADSSFEENVALDNNGNVKTFQNRAGQQIIRVFDALNRITRKTLPSGQGDYAYAYDLHDRLVGAGTYPATTYPISYDSAKRFTGDGNSSVQLDANGNITKLTFPNGTGGANHVSKTYDQLDRLITVTPSGTSPPVATISYDALSRRTLLSFSSSEYAAYSYQLNDDVVNINHVLPSGASASVNIAYGYDKTHKVTSLSVNNGAFFWQPYSAALLAIPRTI